MKLENKKISTIQLTEIPMKTGESHIARVIDQIRNKRQPQMNRENDELPILILAVFESYLYIGNIHGEVNIGSSFLFARSIII